MSTKKAEKSRETKVKQPYLDKEMEPRSIPEIDSLADDYVDAVAARKKATDSQMELAEQIDALMKENNLTEYEYDSRIVRRNIMEKISVKKKKTPTIGGVDGEFVDV